MSETLTDKQRELALETLRSYLRESYRGGRGGPAHPVGERGREVAP